MLMGPTLLLASSCYGTSWTPESVSGLAVWLKADAGLYQERTGAGATTPAVADGDPVGTWRDQSSTAGQWVNGADSRRPTLKLAIKNDLPILRFDAADDELTRTQALTGPITICSVLRTSALGQNNSGSIFGAGGSTNAIQFLQDGFASGLAKMTAGGTTLNLTEPVLNTFEVRTWVFDGASSAGYTNGTLDVVGTTGTLSWSNLIIGADGSGFRHWAGDLGELLIYTGALGSEDRAAVESYLNTRWGVY